MPTPHRTIIVGGVAAGMSVATRLRRLDEHAQITVLERGEYVSFANCGLAYHVGGVIPRREDLLLNSPERLTARFRLDVRTRSAFQQIPAAFDALGERTRAAFSGDWNTTTKNWASTNAPGPYTSYGADAWVNLGFVTDITGNGGKVARSENSRTSLCHDLI